MRVIRPVFIATLLASPLLAQDVERRPMEVDDALNMVYLAGATISPDGSDVLYEAFQLDWEDNTRHVRHFRVPSSGGEATRFLGAAGGSDLSFSPDGSRVALKREVDGTTQLFLMPTDGGEAIQLTYSETSVGPYVWSGDGGTIAFITPAALAEEEAAARKAGEDAYYVNRGPNSNEPGRWSTIRVVDVETRRTREVFGEPLHVYELDLSPDGRRILFVGRSSSNRNDIHHNEIYLLDAGTGALRRLTDNRAVEDSVHWAPDGRRLAYKADDDIEWTHKHDKIWVMDVESGSSRMVSGQYPARIQRFFWSPDGESIKFVGLHGVNTNLYELDLASGEVRALTQAAGRLEVTSFSRSHRRMVYMFQDYDTPPDVYVSAVDDFDPVRLTDLNPWVEDELLLARMELEAWPSDSFTVEGLVYHPPDGDPGPRPLVVRIHGGPPGWWDNAFNPGVHIDAGLGYVSLLPNVRGGSGYTDAFREANTFYKGDGIGMGDYLDLMRGVDHVIARGWAHPDSLAVWGWSYGAILGSYTLTRTERFSAAVLGAGVYDWSAEYGMGYHWDVTRWYIGGTPWTRPERWRALSTISHAEQITTPLLLLHGTADNTTSEPQAMMLFTVLQDMGNVPVRYLRFPREPHGFREPRHNRTRVVESIRWLERHVRGRDWEPWDRRRPEAPWGEPPDAGSGP